MENPREDHILAVTSQAGVYGPQELIEHVISDFYHVIKGYHKVVSEIECVQQGPDDNDGYWDAWNMIMDKVTIHYKGKDYCIVHDEDIWLVPVDWTEDDYSNIFGG